MSDREDRKAHLAISEMPLQFAPGLACVAICERDVPNADAVFEAVLGDGGNVLEKMSKMPANSLLLCKPCLKAVVCRLAELAAAAPKARMFVYAIATRRELGDVNDLESWLMDR